MEAYIINGYRSAVGKSKKGGFRFYRPDDLAADVIKHLVANTPGLEPKLVDDLIVGNAVPEAEQGMQMGRMISLMALGMDVPGFVMNRYCGSGLEAIALAVGKINKKPIVVDDEVIVGNTLKSTLSADHRVLDGAVAGKLLKDFNDIIEDPFEIWIKSSDMEIL